ncbi:hypothetical protein [Specibacter sp. RAF43]|uniref:hypothetical protein n=1 Tax=Specibacter sp. RAF43 TaxID=3233057 RepID=UPI003F9D3BBC
MPLDEVEDIQRRELRDALFGSGMALRTLWFKYFALGGNMGELEIEAYIFGAHAMPALERDLMAHAMNEHYMEQGRPNRVSYSRPSESDDC